MVVTMVPALGGGNSTVQAAEKEKNLTIHFMMPSPYYTSRRAGAYSQKGKVSNLKEMNETFNYLRANGIYSLEDLEHRVSEHSAATESLKKTLDEQMLLFLFFLLLALHLCPTLGTVKLIVYLLQERHMVVCLLYTSSALR